MVLAVTRIDEFASQYNQLVFLYFFRSFGLYPCTKNFLAENQSGQCKTIENKTHLTDLEEIHSLQLFMTKSHPKPFPHDMGSAIE